MYCTKEDITENFKGITFASTGTAVTITALENIINQESEYIDARIATKYQVPVVEATYPEAFMLLKRICIFRVSDRVRNILEVKSGVNQVDSDQKQPENRSIKPQDDLNLIVKGLLILKDVPLASSDAGVSGMDVCGEDLYFDERKQQW